MLLAGCAVDLIAMGCGSPSPGEVAAEEKLPVRLGASSKGL